MASSGRWEAAPPRHSPPPKAQAFLPQHFPGCAAATRLTDSPPGRLTPPQPLTVLKGRRGAAPRGTPARPPHKGSSLPRQSPAPAASSRQRSRPRPPRRDFGSPGCSGAPDTPRRSRRAPPRPAGPAGSPPSPASGAAAGRAPSARLTPNGHLGPPRHTHTPTHPPTHRRPRGSRRNAPAKGAERHGPNPPRVAPAPTSNTTSSSNSGVILLRHATPCGHSGKRSPPRLRRRPRPTPPVPHVGWNYKPQKAQRETASGSSDWWAGAGLDGDGPVGGAVVRWRQRRRALLALSLPPAAGRYAAAGGGRCWCCCCCWVAARGNNGLLLLSPQRGRGVRDEGEDGAALGEHHELRR